MLLWQNFYPILQVLLRFKHHKWQLKQNCENTYVTIKVEHLIMFLIVMYLLNTIWKS